MTREGCVVVQPFVRTGLGVLIAAFVAVSLSAAVALTTGPSEPESPRGYVDTTYVPPSGRVIAVQAGGDFQAALNAARAGDVITLEAGATFAGPFTLPNKPGDDWIIVRSSAPDGKLPPPGTRVDPAHADAMPKLASRSGGVIRAARGAHHYRFIGIEIHPAAGVFLYNLVELGTTETAVALLPHHLIIDRCYLHGDPKRGTRRGIALNSRHTAVVDSYLADFKEVGADSQAIAGWNGEGPFKIVNNYLEGAGENVMFGGADPSIPNLVPSDIEIRRNYFAKPPAWTLGDPVYEGTPCTIKNLFELKSARRVLVDGNVLERNWAHAQTGFAVLFTVRSSATTPWTVVEDVAFTNNIVRHTASGINLLGQNDAFPSQQTKRIAIKNNLFDDVGAASWGGGGRLFQLLAGAADVVIDHNTAFHTGPIIVAEGAAYTGFVFRNNIVPHNDYGISGSGSGTGKPTLDKYFPDAVVKKNVIVGGNAAHYPSDNFFPRSLDAVGFVDQQRGDVRLRESSRYRKAGTDGKDSGVDVDALPAVGVRRPST